MLSYGPVISKPTDPHASLEPANSITERPLGGFCWTFGQGGAR